MYATCKQEPFARHTSGGSLASVELTSRKSQSPSDEAALEIPHISEPGAAPELVGHESAVGARGGGGGGEDIEGESSSAHGGHFGEHPLRVLRHKQFWTLFMVGLANLIAINMYSNTWKVELLCFLHNIVHLLVLIYRYVIKI